MSWVDHAIIKPRSRKPVTGKETLEELLIDEVSYEIFKSKCREIVRLFDQHLFVFSLVNFILKSQFSISDLTSIDSATERHESSIAYFKSLLRGLDTDDGEDRENLDFYLDSAKVKT